MSEKDTGDTVDTAAVTVGHMNGTELAAVMRTMATKFAAAPAKAGQEVTVTLSIKAGSDGKFSITLL